MSQRRTSSCRLLPLWTSVWMTRPWMPVWSVTARRLTTTLWCATPLHQCNVLLQWRLWQPRGLCFVLLHVCLLYLDWSWEKTMSPFQSVFKGRTETNRNLLLHLPFPRASAVQRRGNLQVTDVFQTQAQVKAAASFTVIHQTPENSLRYLLHLL